MVVYGSICCLVARGQGGWPWCARLTGLDSVYGFKREFQRGTRDYTYASGKLHPRGVRLYFAVPPGVYEVHDNLNQSRSHDYFVHVNEYGDTIEISREGAINCLKNDTSASTC